MWTAPAWLVLLSLVLRLSSASGSVEWSRTASYNPNSCLIPLNSTHIMVLVFDRELSSLIFDDRGTEVHHASGSLNEPIEIHTGHAVGQGHILLLASVMDDIPTKRLIVFRIDQMSLHIVWKKTICNSTQDWPVIHPYMLRTAGDTFIIARRILASLNVELVGIDANAEIRGGHRALE